jgi:Eco29kI restriction endonuclease
LLSGFGIHAPGTGRNDQMRSMWDQIHEGRAFAKNRPSNPVTVGTLQSTVDEHCIDMCNQLGCPGSDL